MIKTQLRLGFLFLAFKNNPKYLSDFFLSCLPTDTVIYMMATLQYGVLKPLNYLKDNVTMYKALLFTVSLLVSGVAVANVSNDSACQFDIEFSSKPKENSQTVNASPSVTMDIKQFVATKVVKNAKIASNVMCQHLTGHAYTGSEQEWAGFIDNGIKGLLRAGVTDVQFTKVGTNEAVYNGELANIEYIFTGDNGGNKQVIHNLALLDKKNNQVITISVSGNEKVSDEIKNEYTKLVNSFSL